MNLYFRLLLSLFYSSRIPKISLTQSAHLWFKAYPFDCDLNGHLTNSKYLAFMDLGRVSLIQQLGFFTIFYKKKWFPVLQSLEISFIKEIKPYAKIYLTTKFLGFDDKYLYIDQKFWVNNVLCATARIRGVFVSPAGVVPKSELISIFAEKITELPNSISLWKNYLLEKRHET